MKNYIYIAIVIISVSPIRVFSQDTINLLNGKQIFAKSIFEDPNSSLLKYSYTLHGKEKQTAIDLLNIYSVVYANRTEKIFYRQDSAIGFNLSEKQMWLNIQGERQVNSYYKAPWITVTGFAAGVAAGQFLQFWGLLVPVVYATGLGMFTPQIRTSPDFPYSIKNDYYFLEGYKYTATRKKVKNALLGCLAGWASYAVTSYFINNVF